MGCPTLEVQGLLSDLAEPTMTMAMGSSLEGDFITCSFLEREQSHGLPTAPCLKCTLAELDSTLDKVLGITGHTPVHPVDKLLLLLPPTHSLLQKFRNCLLISALSGSSHINSSLLKSYPLLGLNHVPPKLTFESLLLMALLGDSIIAETQWENLELLWFRCCWSSTPKVCVVLIGGWLAFNMEVQNLGSEPTVTGRVLLERTLVSLALSFHVTFSSYMTLCCSDISTRSWTYPVLALCSRSPTVVI